MSNVPTTRPDLALAIHEQNFFHSVSMVERADGSLLLCAGDFCTSNDRGLTWSKMFTCTDAKGDTVAGQNMVRLEGDGVGVMGQKPLDYGRYEVIFWRSEDGGKTWAAPVPVSPPGFPAHMLQDVVCRTTSGRLIAPLYFGIGQGAWRAEDAPFPGALYKGHFISTDAHYFDPHFGVCYIMYSDDDGLTWHKNKDGEIHIALEYGSIYGATFEPTVAEVEPGKLIMIMRTGLGRLYQAWSQDNGETWSRAQPTSLAADHSPAQIRRLPATGHLFIVWNQLSQEELYRGLNRTRISCAVSRNGGGVWEFFQNVHSCLEPTRVAAGPIRSSRPGEIHALAGLPAANLEGGCVEPLPDNYWQGSYPSVLTLDDRVLISHTHSVYTDHGERIQPGGSSRLKVMPLRWVYGDSNPEAGNPILDKCSVPPTP